MSNDKIPNEIHQTEDLNINSKVNQGSKDNTSSEIFIIESLSTSSELNQGDIIFWPQETDGLKKFGIVVTGDCDIANEKCWGKISVVPFFSMQYYIEHFACIKIFNKISNEIYEIIRKALYKKGLEYTK